MDRSKIIKIALLVCSACCLIAAISLFAEGDITSGVCGLALAAVLGVIAFRKRNTAEAGSGGQNEYSAPSPFTGTSGGQNELSAPSPFTGTPGGQSGLSASPSFARTYKVYIEEGGKRYHRDEKCSGMKNPKYVTLEYALMQGYTECKKCSRIK